MEAGDKRALATTLKLYREKTGIVNYPLVMSVPSSERLPAMYQRDFLKTTALVGMGLATAFDKMVFKKKPSGEMVNDIASEILDTCDQDNLSLEDLMLFLQGLVRGEYGEIPEMSISRFMKAFEGYRQTRHEALLDFRLNEHLNHKAIGDGNRSSKSDPLAEHFSRLGETMSNLRESLRETKKENNVLKGMKDL